MIPKIIVPQSADEYSDHYLAKRGYNIVNVDSATEKKILEVAPDASAVMMFTAKFPNSLYKKMPNLKIIAEHGVGYDNIDVDFAAKQGVWVTNTPGTNARSVAESTVLDILMTAKHSYQISNLMRDNQIKSAKRLMGNELFNSTVGIVGFGNIGQAVAKLLSGFGVKVLIYNRTLKETPYGSFVDWETLFEQSDYITVHLAATPATRHLIGKKEFDLMKSSASLINLARGSILDQEALIQALRTNQIAGAALDVFQEEPLPQDSQLFDFDNVFLTPHTGANTVEAFKRMSIGASKMIDSVLSGKNPDWAVNNPII